MRKRVLFVDEDPGRTGSTVSMEYLVRAFHLNDYEVIVLSFKEDSKVKAGLVNYAKFIKPKTWPKLLTLCFHFTYTISPFSWKGFKIIVGDLIRFFEGIIVISKVIVETNPDLVYANEYSIVQASVAAYLNRVPAIINIRSLYLRQVYWIRRRLISFLILTCNRVVFTITKIEAEQLYPSKKQKDKIKTVGEFIVPQRNIIDINIYRKVFKLPEDKKVVTMLGGIQYIKGTIDFLHAARIVSLKSSKVVFVIAGNNYKHDSVNRNHYDECMNIVEILQHESSIYMFGDITNSLELIAASNIIVSPSTQTHFSRPVIEAWSFSKPVIAARTTHIQELITQDVNGLLFDVGNYNALSVLLIKLLNDEELCLRLGREGKKKVNEEFNAEKNLQFIIDICDSLIKV